MTSVDIPETADHFEPNYTFAAFSYEKYAVGFAALCNLRVARGALFADLAREHGGETVEGAAWNLMYHGLRSMIRHAASQNPTTSLVHVIGQYDTVQPVIDTVIANVYMDEERVGHLSPLLVRTRPSPTTVRSTYNALCKGNTKRLTLPILMDGVETPNHTHWRIRRTSRLFY